ncbi:hypothetical protein AMATHDRAFT_45845 [Amanita thiersii Skay4041]|uniref:Formin GTPase-binding domain-containing protein n=1 Tax=Amanita thiersii Skay4041 TaxID=703135 RepID=A0A2A9NX40_9AGAR|nr:hypothetical protein AMATHDRAFT_45845 [Amanita thiersii Skay4041]
MFKSILPVKRIPSSDFTMITSLADQPMPTGKENHPGSGTAAAAQNTIATQQRGMRQVLTTTKGFSQPTEKKKGKKLKDQPAEETGTNQAFDKLLDELQIPSSLRPKLAGMDSTVKAAMVKSSQTLASNPKLSNNPPRTPRSLAIRKARSTESLDSPHGLKFSGGTYEFPEPPSHNPIEISAIDLTSSPRVSAHHASSVTRTTSPRKASTHSRGLSIDTQQLSSRSQVQLPLSASTVDVTSTFGQFKPTKEKGAGANKSISPIKFCSILTGTSSTQLDVELIKKLRLLLRNEAATWSQDFFRQGGYSALLTRLNEILEVEWREEQHDDQILHELLRCIKALSTSSIGCFALRSSCPTPFVQLVALLYSDKKPGDVATRQLVVELLLILFDLYPPSSLPASGSAYLSRPHRREVWEDEASEPTSAVITLPTPHRTFYSLIRALLLTPAPPPSESPAAPISPHAFIESLHRPRIYKTYLQELSDVCRDYFWVFCHPNNTIWILSETDEGRVEKPRAPGGMTGGVEFEAMGYFFSQTTHLRLINAIAKCVASLNFNKDHDHSAYRFHSDLFLSGLERIILISRKASTTYYPTLHLELARYIDHAIHAGYELPYTVSRLIGMPPPSLAKNPAAASASPGVLQNRNGSPARSRGSGVPPSLPSPKQIEPIKLQ